MKIAMYGGALRHWGLLYPNALTDDVPSPGGTELAMMQVARGLAKRGHQVTVFAECEPGTYEGVDYLKADAAVWLLAMIQWDVVVSWQDPALFLHPLKARLKVLMSQSAHLGVGQVDYAIDRYFGVSRYSAQLLLEDEPYADPSKMWITRNGVDPQRFIEAEARTQAAGVVRNPHRLVWASSPDRGLHHLLPIFRKVRDAIPDAELAICYDFDKTLESYRQTQPGSTFLRFLEQANELKKEPGVTFYQHLSQPKLADLMVTSGVLVYPCDPVRPTETYCNVISEALAAGMEAVISNADCLPENYMGLANILNLPVDHQVWADTIVDLMVNPPYSTLNYVNHLRNLFDYAQVASEWEQLFTSFLSGRETEIDFSLHATRERKPEAKFEERSEEKLVPHG